MKINEESKVRVYQLKTSPIDTWDRKDLKVVSYRNYGWTMSSGGKEKERIKFLWSFYQLNNHNVVSLQYTEYPFKENIDPDLNFHLGKSYLYKDEFWEYWEKINIENDKLHKILTEIEDKIEKDIFLEIYELINKPYENEEQCVRDFFYLNIEKKRYDQTDKIDVK